MHTAYLVMTPLFAVIVAYSGLGKIRRDPHQVRVLHETIGVPFKYFPLLAACEFAGAVGLVVGIWWPLIGIAPGIGLVLYFAGAIISHLRVRDVKGIGPAAFMLILAAGVLALRVLTILGATEASVPRRRCRVQSAEFKVQDVWSRRHRSGACAT